MHGGHEEAPIAVAVGSEDEVIVAGYVPAIVYRRSRVGERDV
jgi:hypothetical protein